MIAVSLLNGWQRNALRSFGLRGNFRDGGDELTLYAFHAKQEDPPDADGQRGENQGERQQLFQGFHIADEMLRNNKSFEGPKGDKPETEEERHARPHQGRSASP